MNRNLCNITCLLILLALGSCVSTKDIVYFGNIPPDDPKVKLSEYQEPLIQVDDMLNIVIQTLDGGMAISGNQLSGDMATPTSGTTQTGYLVDEEGQITMPMLGTFTVAGLTTSALRKIVTKQASRYFNDPTVQVRFANFKITVMGEVSRPATYTVPNEKVTLLDALGMAGDLTIYGNRKNVLLVRDNAGEKEFVRFNLNDYDTFRSPHFYLKQNDVIYVEPGKGRLASANATTTQAISITISVISFVSVLLFRFL